MVPGGFRPLILLTQGSGLAAVAMVAAWTVGCRGGLAWSGDPDLQFNWHPLLNTVGSVYLFANAILVFRTLPKLPKKSLKLIHAGVTVASVVLAVVGTAAVVDSHGRRDPPVTNFYSLHSWMGIATAAIFLLQWVVGFAAFLYPGFSISLRGSILPLHTFMGLLVFVFAIATALTGLKEKAKLSVRGYSSFDGETYLINAIGLTLLAFGAFVVYLATSSEYKRRAQTLG